MALTHLTSETFDQAVNAGDDLVVVDFFATWCGPCKMVSPLVDEIALENADIKVGKINVDEQPELAAKFGVMSIPTLVVMENGKEVNRSIGAMPKANILKLVK